MKIKLWAIGAGILVVGWLAYTKRQKFAGVFGPIPGSGNTVYGAYAPNGPIGKNNQNPGLITIPVGERQGNVLQFGGNPLGSSGPGQA